jgi:hypothetical protein
MLNLEAGFELNGITFFNGFWGTLLIFSIPSPLYADSLLVSGVRGERFHVPLFREAPTVR